MTNLSKRAHGEVLGWAFKAIPWFWAAGTFWTSPQTRQHSARQCDHKRPERGTATPLPGLPASPRWFDIQTAPA